MLLYILVLLFRLWGLLIPVASIELSSRCMLVYHRNDKWLAAVLQCHIKNAVLVFSRWLYGVTLFSCCLPCFRWSCFISVSFLNSCFWTRCYATWMGLRCFLVACLVSDGVSFLFHFLTHASEHVAMLHERFPVVLCCQEHTPVTELIAVPWSVPSILPVVLCCHEHTPVTELAAVQLVFSKHFEMSLHLLKAWAFAREVSVGVSRCSSNRALHRYKVLSSMVRSGLPE